MKETIEETTMGTLGDVPTGMASMGVGAYLLPDGSEAKGMSCVLAPVGEANVIVGLGSIVDVQGDRWEVVQIEKTRGEPGNVTLELREDDSETDSDDLDYRYSTTCPACGDNAAWTGGMAEQLGQPVMVMRCEDCSREFGWYSGQLAPALRQGPLDFIPGAKPTT